MLEGLECPSYLNTDSEESKIQDQAGQLSKNLSPGGEGGGARFKPGFWGH